MDFIFKKEDVIDYGNYLLSDLRQEDRGDHAEFPRTFEQREQDLKKTHHPDFETWFNRRFNGEK